MISTIINTNCLYSLSIRAFLFSNKSQSGSLKHHLNMERLLHFPFRQRTHHTCMPHLPLLLMTFLLPNSFSIFPSCHCQQTSFIFFSYCFLPNLILCLWGVVCPTSRAKILVDFLLGMGGCEVCGFGEGKYPF